MDSTASAALSSRLLRDFEAGQEAQARRAVKSEQPESGRLMGPGPFGGQDGGHNDTMEQDPLDADQSSMSFASESGFHRSRTAYSMHAQSQASASEAWTSHPRLAAERTASAQAMPPPQHRHRYERDESVALGSEQPERKPLLGWYTHASEPGEQGMRQLATMQARLNERLGPEYISDRQGGGGSRMKYLEGWKAIDLANDVFGFNGWSTSIRKIETPVCREKSPGRWDIGVYVVMRVTLRDGTFHEDVGWGMMENSPSLGSGLEKAKKEAVTDALKRSLRTFGRLLGNCLYDKKWVDWVSKVKAPVEKFEMGQLHRRADLKPPPPPREETSMASTPTLNGSSPEDGDADASTASTSARPAAAAANGGMARSATAQVTNTTAGAGPNPHNQLATAGRPRPPPGAVAAHQPNGNGSHVGRSATAQPMGAAAASASASGSGSNPGAGLNITADEQARLQASRRAEAMARQAKFAQRQQQQQQQRDQTPDTRSPSPTKPAQQQQQQQQQQAPPPAAAAAASSSSSSSSPSAAAQVFASTPGAKWAKPKIAAQPATKAASPSALGGLNEADLRAASEAMDLSQQGAGAAGVTSLSSAGAGAGSKRLAAGPRGSDGAGGGMDRRPLGDLEVGDDGAVKRQRRA